MVISENRFITFKKTVSLRTSDFLKYCIFFNENFMKFESGLTYMNILDAEIIKMLKINERVKFSPFFHQTSEEKYHVTFLSREYFS